MSYFPLTIQRLDEETEEWTDFLHLHALKVNQPVSYGFGDRESHAAAAEQFHPRLQFEIRWCKAIEDAVYTPQLHRIIYKGRQYNIQGYDDYMEQNRTVKVYGESYG